MISEDLEDIITGRRLEWLSEQQWLDEEAAIRSKLFRLVESGLLVETTFLIECLSFWKSAFETELQFVDCDENLLHYQAWWPDRTGAVSMRGSSSVVESDVMGPVQTQERDLQVRRLLIHHLLGGELREVTFQRTFSINDDQYRNRYFATPDRILLERIVADGPSSGGYGRLGSISRRQLPLELVPHGFT